MNRYQVVLAKLNNNKGILFASLFFLILYSSISLVNHYNFRTYGLDLGVYVNTVYDYAHFNIATNQVWAAKPVNMLSDHFDLFLILISPLTYLFHTYTLLLVQLVFIIIGGIGIYKFADMVFQNKKNALIISICFFSFYGIFSALAFDYHSNVIAAMIVPWFFLFFFQSRWVNCTIVFLLILITKENMSLWLAFIAFGLIIHFRHDKTKMIKAALYCVIALSWFIMVVKIFMPALYSEEIYSHMHYQVLGSNFSEIVRNLIFDPLHSFKLLFINHTNNPHADWLKTELHVFILLSGGLLLFLKPQFFLMLIPIYCQKLFHNEITVWGISSQYSIEYAPILFIGGVCVIKDFKKEIIRNSIIYLLLILTVSVTIRSFDRTYSYFDRSKQRFYQVAHWTRNFDIQQTYKAMNLIPPDGRVSAQGPFVPHLAERKHIYEYPIIKDADYIMLSITDSPYPLSAKEYDQKLIEIFRSKRWVIIYNSPPVIILKKIN